MSERRRPCWREWLPLAVLLTCPERVVEAQARFPWPLVQLGLVSQGSPLTSESGWALGARLPIGLTRHLRLAPTFEFAKTHVTSSIVPCFFVGTPPQCFHRPDQEPTLYFGAVLTFSHSRMARCARLQKPVGRSAAVGHRRTRVRSAASCSHSGGWVLTCPPRFGVLSAGGFLRILDRCPDRLDKGTMTTLLIGFRPGGRR